MHFAGLLSKGLSGAAAVSTDIPAESVPASLRPPPGGGVHHLVGGIAGALLIGFFGTKMTNGANGVFYKGGWTLMGHQAVAVVAVVAVDALETVKVLGSTQLGATPTPFVCNRRPAVLDATDEL